MGLDDQIYGTVCSTLLSIEPLPSLNQLYSRIVREERHRSVARTSDGRRTAFNSQTHAEKKIDRSNLKCIACEGVGHTIDGCFAVIGYPEWWGARPKSEIKNQKVVLEYLSGIKTGRGRGRGNSRRPVARNATVHIDQKAKLDNSLGLLDKLDHQQESGKIVDDWIIDTGANHHMTGDLDLLTDIVHIEPCVVDMPDNRSVHAMKQGLAKLGPNILLQNDRTSKTLIGLGRRAWKAVALSARSSFFIGYFFITFVEHFGA
ncbi:hypothetical protein M569_16465 [Genlisea aurea]|uniref:Retrovirus-related Pol polyprotein from transposon TNT 1-94-like beta-barrel domain-containing protein n=1 Tax=Genlisea aurea TaxID=192259 RepID=S8BUW8_9LAMI|nr:hypothetical protein M569_16465 [Genlisea aurea]